MQRRFLLDFLDRENDPQLLEVLLDFLEGDRCLVDLFRRLLFKIIFLPRIPFFRIICLLVRSMRIVKVEIAITIRSQLFCSTRIRLVVEIIMTLLQLVLLLL